MIPSISILLLLLSLKAFVKATNSEASLSSFNFGSYPCFSTKLNRAFKVVCKSSGLPNFSKSQLSNSVLLGAYGITKDSDNFLN